METSEQSAKLRLPPAEPVSSYIAGEHPFELWPPRMDLPPVPLSFVVVELLHELTTNDALAKAA